MVMALLMEKHCPFCHVAVHCTTGPALSQSLPQATLCFQVLQEAVSTGQSSGEDGRNGFSLVRLFSFRLLSFLSSIRSALLFSGAYFVALENPSNPETFRLSSWMQRE